MIDYLNDLIDLSDWKTKEKIISELKAYGININERALRQLIEKNNIEYANHNARGYIAHGKKGYRLTNDSREIYASVMDLKKRAMNELWKYSKTSKAIGENANFDFLEELING